MTVPNVVILMGGPDAEREISIASGTAVSNALKKNSAYKTNLVLIDEPCIEEIAAMHADVIFPALHGPYGEGGRLQTVLEETGVPFVGSGSKACAIAMDKVASKKIAKELGIPTPDWSVVDHIEQPCLQTPFVLKPIDDGSSIDIFVCHEEHVAREALIDVLQRRKAMLAEEFKKGREITVGIACGRVLPTIEIIPQSGNYDFAAKYERSDTRYILDPPLRDQQCVEWALQLVDAMHVRDVARVDFIVDDNGPWFLEINTMPGFTDHSLLPMAAAHFNWDMSTLCSKLVASALSRSATAEC